MKNETKRHLQFSKFFGENVKANILFFKFISKTNGKSETLLKFKQILLETNFI